MVVQQDETLRVVHQRPFDDRPAVDGCLCEGSLGKHFRGDYRIVIGEEDPPDLLMVQSVENVMDRVRSRLAVENLCGLFAFVFK